MVEVITKMVYPYRIRIIDPLVIKEMKRLSSFRAIKTDPNISKRIGRKVPRSIKRDGFEINRGLVAITNPRLKLDFEPAYGKRKGFDFIFKNIF